MFDYDRDDLDGGGEEKSVALWLGNFAVKILPLLAVVCTVFIFLKYGVLIALMSIFSFVIVFYLGLALFRSARKSRSIFPSDK
jgi:Na+/H+-dicarboxylate symporter